MWKDESCSARRRKEGGRGGRESGKRRDKRKELIKGRYDRLTWSSNPRKIPTISLSPFIRTHILDPTHLSMSSTRINWREKKAVLTKWKKGRNCRTGRLLLVHKKNASIHRVQICITKWVSLEQLVGTCKNSCVHISANSKGQFVNSIGRGSKWNCKKSGKLRTLRNWLSRINWFVRLFLQEGDVPLAGSKNSGQGSGANAPLYSKVL